MAIWKQLIAACAALAMAFASWAWLAPASFPAPLRPLAELAGLLPEADDQQEARGGAPGGGPPGRSGGGPQQVITASVGEELSSRRVQSVGTAEALRSVSLFAPTAGLVTEMLFTTGDRVAEGQPLLRLDAREETIAVEKAGIALQQARDQLGRFERLSQNQAVSTVQVEEARARVASAEAELRGAELDLDRRTLRAPFDGYMGIAKVTIGDRVTTTTEVANIDDRSEILIRYALPERFAAQAQPGARVEATSIAFGVERFEGVIAEIDSRIDPQLRTLTIRAAIDNSDDRLRPGLSFLVDTVFEGALETAVPLLSLQWDRDGSYLWRVVDDRAQRVDVEILERGETRALVNGDLTPGDRVVLEGVQRLRDGAPVTIAEHHEADPGRS
ncbi:efflux RND transporter periplasmic adaptor subunit [Saliniramus sp.]|uniref:efflux RND transporter periplasmic adaptor subunit n=1 Tax=Saliniramus sp. TaxID=2986772 RepID=UPI002CCC2AFC|nr:efflux RND transporter periplasmic adaptor subunit [Saliniramus sp.]HMB10349.1 efflux RND transporter periplasmic adaptor subunit [Saliniramus sp.]